MAYTLANLTYRVASELGITLEGIATGGSTATIVDTTRTEADDFWNGGSAWVLYDAAGAGAAPQGEVKTITDYALTSGTITCGAWSAAPAAGDRYAIADKRVPLRILEQQINAALLSVGRIPMEYTSLTTATNQTEYTLPTNGQDLRQVFIQTKLSVTNDNYWQEILNWKVVNGKVILPDQPNTGYSLKLVYVAYHSTLVNATDTLSEYVPLVRVVYPAILNCLTWQAMRTKWSDWQKQIDYFQAKAVEIAQTHPIHLPRRPSQVQIVYSDDPNYTPQSEPNKVYL